MLPRRASHDCRLGRAFPLGPRSPARSLALQSLRPTQGQAGRLRIRDCKRGQRTAEGGDGVSARRPNKNARQASTPRLYQVFFISTTREEIRILVLAGGIDAEVGDPNSWVELVWGLFKLVEILPIVGRHDGIERRSPSHALFNQSLVCIVMYTPGRAGRGRHSLLRSDLRVMEDAEKCISRGPGVCCCCPWEVQLCPGSFSRCAQSCYRCVVTALAGLCLISPHDGLIPRRR